MDVSSSVRRQTRVMAPTMLKSLMPVTHGSSSREVGAVGAGATTGLGGGSHLLDRRDARSCSSFGFSASRSELGSLIVIGGGVDAISLRWYTSRVEILVRPEKNVLAFPIHLRRMRA